MQAPKIPNMMPRNTKKTAMPAGCKLQRRKMQKIEKRKKEKHPSDLP
jgi:hypothetical protein